MSPLKTRKKSLNKTHSKNQKKTETQITTRVHKTPIQLNGHNEEESETMKKTISKNMKIMHKLDASIKATDSAEFEYMLRHLSVKQLQDICTKANISFATEGQKRALNHKQLCIRLKRAIKKAHNHLALVDIIEKLVGLTSVGLFALGTLEMKHTHKIKLTNIPDLLIGIIYYNIIIPILYSEFHGGKFPSQNDSKPYYTVSSMFLFAILFINSLKSKSIKKKNNTKLLIVNELLKYKPPIKNTNQNKPSKKKWWML